MADDIIKAQIDALESKPGASSVTLGPDGFLKVVIDLNVKNELFIETRVGAYGTIAWAQELASRWIMAHEMKYSRDKAVAADKLKLVSPPPGVIDIRGINGSK